MRKILADAGGFCGRGIWSWSRMMKNSGLECTSIVVGRLASMDGSAMTSQTRRRHFAHLGENRSSEGSQARFRDSDRKNWRKTKFVTDTAGIKIVEEIPQVAHTYSSSTPATLR